MPGYLVHALMYCPAQNPGFQHSILHPPHQPCYIRGRCPEARRKTHQGHVLRGICTPHRVSFPMAFSRAFLAHFRTTLPETTLAPLPNWARALCRWYHRALRAGSDSGQCPVEKQVLERMASSPRCGLVPALVLGNSFPSQAVSE